MDTYRRESFQACLDASSAPPWEAIQRAKGRRLNLLVVWLDLANVYGSVPYQLIWKTLETHHVPRRLVQIIQTYFDGYMMRLSTKTNATKWVLQWGAR